jgi:hypothetical protein
LAFEFEAEQPEATAQLLGLQFFDIFQGNPPFPAPTELRDGSDDLSNFFSDPFPLQEAYNPLVSDAADIILHNYFALSHPTVVKFDTSEPASEVVRGEANANANANAWTFVQRISLLMGIICLTLAEPQRNQSLMAYKYAL